MEHKFIYKLIAWLSKLTYRIGYNLNQTSKELNFLKYKIEFGERDDDIYIVTYPKSGTTLTQMLLYQMTTDGNMNFNHIYEVSPWLSNDAFKRKPIKIVPSPRIIKSHNQYKKFDKYVKGRFIYVYRDVCDVVVSQYHQRKNYGKPDLDFDKFFGSFIKDKKMNWFTFNRDWLVNKNKLNILYLKYEDLTTDLDSCIMKISQFLELDPKSINMKRVHERCSFKYMKKHEDKFGEQPVEKPEFVYNQFIREGKSGSGKQKLSTEQVQLLEKIEKSILGKLIEKGAK